MVISASALFAAAGFWSGCSSSATLTLERMEPTEGHVAVETGVTIHGAGFSGSPKAYLVGSGGVELPLSAIRVVDSTKIEATVPAGGEPGSYDLKVTDGEGGSVTLGGAFLLKSSALRIYFIDVGQGAATLIISPSGRSLLIDAGKREAGAVVAALMTRVGVKVPDYVLISHWHDDHFGGIEQVLAGPDGKPRTSDDTWPPGALLHRGRAVFPQRGSTWTSYLKQRGEPATKAIEGDSTNWPSIDLGAGVEVAVRIANGRIKIGGGAGSDLVVSCGLKSDCSECENCRSVGALLRFGGFSMWTAGDLTGKDPDVESKLGPVLGRVTLFQSHHHGSGYSNTRSFLMALSPAVVVASAGSDNLYCHPGLDALTSFATVKGLWFLLTSAGITAETGKCGRSTATDATRLLPGRHRLGVGTMVLETQVGDQYTVKDMAGKVVLEGRTSR